MNKTGFTIVKKSLIIFTWLILVIINVKSEFIPKCDFDIHQFEFDDLNRIKFGVVQFDLPKILVRNGSKLEIFYEFENFPVNPEHVPELNFTINEELILNEDGNISIGCEIYYNLERKIPKLKRMTWISAENSKAICENIDKKIFGIHLRKLYQLLLENKELVDSEPKIFKCHHVESDFYKFKDLSLNKSNQQFFLDCDVPIENIRRIKITGKINELTSEICNSFPYLTSLDVSGVGLKKIQVNAFLNCTILEELNLADNELNIIPIALFPINFQLKKLLLSRNKIKSFPIKIIKNLSYLQQLLLDTNLLTSFNMHDGYQRYDCNLHILDLRNNPPISFDANDIHNYCRILEHFYYDY